MTRIIVERIRRRLLEQNKNFLGVIVGETGSGKSYTALKLAKEIDPTFTIERVVFTPEDFIALLNSGTLTKGNAVVFDEAGVGLPARAWMSISNKCINYVLQTFRHENLCVLFTVPSLAFIDVQARQLFHAYLETLRIDHVNKLAYVKILFLQPNPRFGKVYFRYYRYPSADGPKRITHLELSPPDPQLIEAYEAKKQAFTSSLKLDVESDIRAVKTKKRKPKAKATPEEISKKVLAEPEAWIKTIRTGKRVNMDKLAVGFGVGRAIAGRAKQLIESELNKNGGI